MFGGASGRRFDDGKEQAKRGVNIMWDEFKRTAKAVFYVGAGSTIIIGLLYGSYQNSKIGKASNSNSNTNANTIAIDANKAEELKRQMKERAEKATSNTATNTSTANKTNTEANTAPSTTATPQSTPEEEKKTLQQCIEEMNELLKKGSTEKLKGCDIVRSIEPDTFLKDRSGNEIAAVFQNVGGKNGHNVILVLKKDFGDAGADPDSDGAPDLQEEHTMDLNNNGLA